MRNIDNRLGNILWEAIRHRISVEVATKVDKLPAGISASPPLGIEKTIKNMAKACEILTIN